MASRAASRSRQQFLVGQDARREMSEMYAWYERNVKGGGNLPEEPFSHFGTRTVRIARTTTDAANPTYPSRPANTFVIEFGYASFTKTPGLQSLTFTPWNPAETRVAHDINCTYYEEGSIVLVYLVDDQWYMFGGGSNNLLAIAELAEDMCGETGGSGSGGSGLGTGGSILVVNAKLLPNCTDFEPAMVTNPRKHRGKIGQQVVMVKKACLSGSGSGLSNCSAASEEWEILDVELRKYCAVVGLENRPSCLVYGSLFLAGEWCPEDEPTTACKVVDYTDCSGALPACDLSWVYTASSCCGDGSGSGG